MDNLIYYLQGEPLVLFLLGLFLVSLAVVIPPLILARFFLPTKEARPKGGKKGIVKYFRANPKAILALISIVIIITSGVYLYNYFNQPVRIVTASQFKFERGRDIRDRYEKRFKYTMDWLAIQTYDAVDLLLRTIDKAGVDPDSMRNVFQNLDSEQRSLPGLAGPIYFNSHGSLAREATVAVYTGSGWKLRDEGL